MNDGFPTTLRDLGDIVTYPPIVHALSPASRAHFANSTHISATACSYGSHQSWAHTLRRMTHTSATLRVGVLGCSTTAGCGALSPELRCSMPLSWGRRAHDTLSAALRPRIVNTSLYHKNAVEAAFFWDCTHQLLPPAVDVVLVEILQNMYQNPRYIINGTVSAIRRTAPHAAIMLVGWVKNLHEVTTRPPIEFALGKQIAAAMGVGFIDVPAAMRILKLRNSDVYAWHADRQDHHPNAMGHQLIGEQHGLTWLDLA